jgi:parallel beta-helix repeat protein
MAETLYVSENGAGSKNGTSYDNRWDGFSSIVWGTGTGKVGAGDTLYVCGTVNGTLAIGASGTLGNVITIRGDYPGDTGIINSTEPVQGGLYGLDVNFINVEYMEVTNPIQTAIKFAVNSDNIIVRNCTLHNTDFWGALFENCTNVTFNDNVVYDTCQGGIAAGEAVRFYACTTGSAYNNNVYDIGNIGIDLIDGTTDFDVYDNTVHDLTLPGASVGIYIDNASGNRVYRNEIYNCIQPGITISSETASSYSSNNFIYNNVIYGCGGGILLGRFDTAPDIRSKNNFIYNNTCYGNGIYSELLIEDSSNYETIKNNVFYETNSTRAVLTVYSGGETGLILDYNCYYRTGGSSYIFSYLGEVKSFAEIQALGYEANGKRTDPLLTSDYHLQRTSPCIDAGVNLPEVTDDYEGNPRPIGASTDIGAYEHYNAKIKNGTFKHATLV